MNTKTLNLKPKTRAEIEALVYANGGNSPAVIRFHEDGGHGWLQVPHQIIKALGIEKDITCYSYLDAENGYLEEDCDLSLFFRATEFSNDKSVAEIFWNVVPNDYNENSPIRNKQHYPESPAQVERKASRLKTSVVILLASILISATSCNSYGRYCFAQKHYVGYGLPGKTGR